MDGVTRGRVPGNPLDRDGLAVLADEMARRLDVRDLAASLEHAELGRTGDVVPLEQPVDHLPRALGVLLDDEVDERHADELRLRQSP